MDERVVGYTGRWSVRGGIRLWDGLVLAGLQLCNGGWGRGRRGRGRGGGFVLVVTVVGRPPSLPCSLNSTLPPQMVGSEGLLQHRAVLPPVVHAELPKSLQQMSCRAATSLLTLLLLLLSPRTGLRWHARVRLCRHAPLSNTHQHTHIYIYIHTRTHTHITLQSAAHHTHRHLPHNSITASRDILAPDGQAHANATSDPLTNSPLWDLLCSVTRGGGIHQYPQAQRKEPARLDSTDINTTNTPMHLCTHFFTFTLVGRSRPDTDLVFRMKMFVKTPAAFLKRCWMWDSLL